MKQLESCKAGDHSLITIRRIRCVVPGEEEVIRWCECCGSIVIDMDMDNRVYPGRIKPMKNPNILRQSSSSVSN